jgi:hypothetical protein
MIRSELIKRSPLRIFEKSIHGGLGAGNIGMLVSPKGVGKTACLVHIATDKLLQSKHVIHVSFSSRVDHIINWYEDIFKEIAKKRSLEGAVDVHDEIIKNRVIMNFNQQSLRADQVLRSVSAMIVEGRFEADSVIFDGYDIVHGGIDDLRAIREFAAASRFEVWISVSVPEGAEPAEYVEPFVGEAAVVITLESVQDHVHFKALKDHDTTSPKDMHLDLDPKTLLIVEEA